MGGLIEVHGKKLTVTSLVVAELFKRSHGAVLKDLDKLVSKIHLDSREYTESLQRWKIKYLGQCHCCPNAQPVRLRKTAN